jgi:PIN domain nuclease of toxin-antitoxin system
MKERAGKLRFDRPLAAWVEQALTADPRLTLLPLSPSVAIAAVDLQWDHRDPADRLIVATALVHEATLATGDETIAKSGLLCCLWD